LEIKSLGLIKGEAVPILIMNNTPPIENHLDLTTPRWFAIYTRFKREKVVLEELQRKRIEAYLPIQKKVRMYGKRRRVSELPLFNCYLFVKITKSEYVPVLETENVFRFIKFSKNLLAIPEREIEIIRNILGENIPVRVRENGFVEGDTVIITRGNLIGIKGKLLEKRSKGNVLVELDHVGFTLQLTMDVSMLERIESSNSLLT